MKKYTLLIGFAILIILIVSIYIYDNQKINNLGNEKLISELNLKAKCLEDGKKVHDEQVKQYYGDNYLLDPIYTYSPELNTCLWAQSYTGKLAFDTSVDVYVAFIMDVYSNKSILEYETNNGKQLTDVTQDQFNKKFKELFGTDKDFPFITQN